MGNISRSVKKKDHESKITGSALYVDNHVMESMLYGKLLHSAKAKARITNISLPKLPEGYFVSKRNNQYS